MQVSIQLQLKSCTVNSDGSIQADFSDGSGVTYYGGEQQFSDPQQWVDYLKKLLVLDWTQENIIGKTAIMDCATPDDIWVKAV
jgi:hypothetical protein